MQLNNKNYRRTTAAAMIAEGIGEWEAMKAELRDLHEDLLDNENIRSWAAMEADRFEREGDYEAMQDYWDEVGTCDQNIHDLRIEIRNLERELRIAA